MREASALPSVGSVGGPRVDNGKRPRLRGKDEGAGRRDTLLSPVLETKYRARIVRAE